MWKVIYDYGIEIENNIADFELPRETDSTIASNLAAKFHRGAITRSKLSKAIKCRKYLRVLTITDIAPGDGRSINNNILKDKIQLDRVRRLEWTVRGKHKATDWAAWRNMLKVSVLSYQDYPMEPVGKWISTIDDAYIEHYTWW